MARDRRRSVVIAVVVVVVAAAAGWWLTSRGVDDPAEEADAQELSTATIERRDLVERETFGGALGFEDARSLTSVRAGTLTSIGAEGAVLRRGDALYEVDERPTVLLLGTVPAYRALSSGLEGADVRQLQRNLLALGFDDGGDLDVSGEFDADTAEAVRDWQEELGLDRAGVIELGDVAFEAGPRRMGPHALEVGSSVGAGTQVATTSSPRRVVTLELDASDQDLVARGDRVRVELPSGEVVDGRVSSVARVAETDATDPEAEPTIEVIIRLLDPVESRLDEAPVDVAVETGRAEGVLTVPVQALLALAEGGYAVEVVDGPDGSHLVGVDTGEFADGFVEISGEGLSEGLEVVTAA